jgi:hypothetical protein
MYVSAQQEHAEAFLRERILPGFRASRTCREKLKRARVIGNELYFPEMMLALTWAQSTGGQKTRPMCRLLLDEVSTFSGFSLDKFRKRVVTFSETSKIVYCSTQDARGNLDSLADPMVQAWMETAQHEWHVQDPGSGRWFQPMFGVDFKTGRMGKHGVRWDPEARNTDGTWNLERVGATAHYLCPSGAVVTGAAKAAWMERGKWVRVTSRSAPKDRVGYRVGGLVSNYWSWASLATEFLRAKQRGASAIHIYVMEVLAEMWLHDTKRADDSILARCQAAYGRGEVWWSKPEAEQPDDQRPVKILTVDVQKDHFWWVFRAWTPKGGSALIDWGQAWSWNDLADLADKRDAEWVFVDSGYGERTAETYMACADLRFHPTKGFSKKLTEPWVQREINPAEGTRRGAAGDKLTRVDYDADLFKDLLHDLITGSAPEHWLTYDGIERGYVRQLTSEQKTKAGWEPVHRENHLWDCEAMQIMAAMMLGLFRRPELAKAEGAE